ncbi:hypothetical protein Ple7327_4115 [Pleurocapsa sp. PCC 7327]|uniref:ATP-dependent zinc protease family protein n=1 Tax=Pleurocapsa sp. PCC 7327 TaxID=118163 RepID=UPI00029FE2EE|nr:RimK/LysX family protein [Pleurocapsa sp. PCC 7327]AFY79246.1 hypothetical protein Ple7327_4115 [Pleurocapsa sp. PCC 7327]
MKARKQLPVIGWREWIELPELGIEEIKAKIDTGARSSALHAMHVESFEQEGKEIVRFQVHPYQRDSYFTVSAQAQLLEWRQIRNSGGDTQLRPVIQTAIKLGGLQWSIELTLTNRDVMGFRMLLGREGVRRRFLVNPGRSYLLSHQLERQTKHFF